MKRRITHLMLALVTLASCGTAGQYSYSRYQDGIYFSQSPEPEKLVLLTEDDFRRLAAQNIAQKDAKTAWDSIKVTYVNVYPGDYYWDMYFSPYPLISTVIGYSWSFNQWYLRRWSRPWDAFDSWWAWNWSYDRWFRPWYDPWYGPGYYPYGPYIPYGPYGPYSPWGPGWYRPYGPYGPYGPVYPGGPGWIDSRNYSYGPRYKTEPAGSRVVRPGSGESNRRDGTVSYSNGTGGTGGNYRPGSGSGSNGGYTRSSGVTRSSNGTYRVQLDDSPTQRFGTSGSSSTGTTTRGSGSPYVSGGNSSGYVGTYRRSISSGSSSTGSGSSTRSTSGSSTRSSEGSNSSRYSRGTSSSTPSYERSSGNSSRSGNTRSSGGSYSGGSSYSGGGGYSGGASHSGGGGYSGGGGGHSRR